MNQDFDIERHKIVGVLKKQFNSIHADFYVVGYIDTNSHFNGFSREEAKIIFPETGKVFAPKFATRKGYDFNELICFNVKEADNYESGSGKDFYLADYDARIYKYAITRICKLDLDVLKLNDRDILKAEMINKYYKSNDLLYYFTSDFAKYWIFDDEFRRNQVNNICGYDDDYFIVFDDLENEDGYIDFLSDEGTVSFILNLYKHTNASIVDTKDMPQAFVKKAKGVPLQILQQRFNRFNDLLSKYTLSYQSVVELSTNTLLREVVERSIQCYEIDFLKAAEAKHHSTIRGLEKTQKRVQEELDIKAQELKANLQVEQEILIAQYKEEIDSIKRKILQKKEDVALLESEIEEKQCQSKQVDSQIERLQESKERLIADYSIVKEVLGNSYSGSQKNNQQIHIEIITGVGEPIQTKREFKDSIICPYSIEKNKLFKLFLKRRVLLLPNVLVVKALIDAIGDYCLLSVCVGAHWKSFGNLYENGLEEILLSCKEYPNKVHFLVLQNMNLSYIPLYMQPINDVLIGLKRTLPGGLGLAGIPNNLWIIGTRTKEEAMMLPEDYIKEYGCLSYNIEEREKAVELAPQLSNFLSLETIHSWQRELVDDLDTDIKYESDYESYLEE